MFEKLRRLYVSGELTAVGLASAATRGWIIGAQKQEILSEEQ